MFVRGTTWTLPFLQFGQQRTEAVFFRMALCLSKTFRHSGLKFLKADYSRAWTGVFGFLHFICDPTITSPPLLSLARRRLTGWRLGWPASAWGPAFCFVWVVSFSSKVSPTLGSVTLASKAGKIYRSSKLPTTAICLRSSAMSWSSWMRVSNGVGFIQS